ncbi:MAG: radical SAM/SPASM domain-containing protein [Candidatus Hodarchaeales archaeon]
MSTEKKYLESLNESINSFFKTFRAKSIRNPLLAFSLYRIANYQKKAATKRLFWQKELGLNVPPMIIASITNHCNLSCKGCYSHARRRSNKGEMSTVKLESVFEEARDLGVSLIVLVGGEPLMREELLDITRLFPEIVFLLVTNGLLINEQTIKRLKKQRNVIPFISLEGGEQETDDRRGNGVFNSIMKKMKLLDENNIVFGTSITLTSRNLPVVTREKFVSDLYEKGCKLFFYMDYVPVDTETEFLTPTKRQKKLKLKIFTEFNEKLPALFVVYPGAEKKLGSCPAAGKGFIHLSSDGKIEPCPFTPYSDSNVNDMTLKQALQSDFLKEIRESGLLDNSARGGCVLWEERIQMERMLQSKYPDETTLPMAEITQKS